MKKSKIKRTNLIKRSRLTQKAVIIIYDSFSIPCAWILAYWLRFNLNWISYEYLVKAALCLPVLITMQMLCYYYFRVYLGVWRFSSTHDLWKIIKAVFVATTLSIVSMLFLHNLESIPRSIWPMYSVILISFMCSGRLVIRTLLEAVESKNKHADLKRVLIVGAGQAGESLVRDIRRNSGVHYHVVGFIDDNRNKLGSEIQGFQVLGPTAEIKRICLQFDIDLIFIAIPSLNSQAMRRIVRSCDNAGVSFRTLPSLVDIVSGHVNVNALREVELDDLLGREQIELTWDKITAVIESKRVVVTGGGGSIGSELCRQIAKLKPNKLLIIENCEFNAYKIHQEISQHFPLLDLEISLASILDKFAVSQLLFEFKADVLFHAAAYKHVPLLEEQTRLAVRNNILGTRVMAELSDKYRVKKFILISTDKAVNPTNIMGTTKRAAELYCQNLNSYSKTEFITVRFGNVLGSAGSVIPLFQQQLEKGGPLTVTHKDISRYFMTIPEASRLILQAAANGYGGEIFVLDMGEPIKIKYLAEQLIRLSGKTPYKDIYIEFTGLRPGEKLFEELFHESEALQKTEHKKLLMASYREVNWDILNHIINQLEYACDQTDVNVLKKLLLKIVPEAGLVIDEVIETENA